MKIIYNSIFLEHDTGMHPENKKRLIAFENLKESEISDGEKYLELIHSKDYINEVKEECKIQGHIDPETVCSKGSYKAATMAVGATILASEQDGFALVRPPGHHAYPDRSSGFCIFNNIAIAAKKLSLQGKKVCILDFDSHLGDGTNHIFKEDPYILYFSLHQFPAFPGGGFADDIGKKKGEGFTINIPLPPGIGDDLFLYALKKYFPIILQFKPDVIAVSAGFDGHVYDLLLDLKLTYSTFYEIGKIISQNFHNVFATLEGGYNIETLPACVYSFIDGINGSKIRFLEDKTKTDKKEIDLFSRYDKELSKNLSKYWSLK